MRSFSRSSNPGVWVMRCRRVMGLPLVPLHFEVEILVDVVIEIQPAGFDEPCMTAVQVKSFEIEPGRNRVSSAETGARFSTSRNP